jgi:lipid-binding SYLF domain-containing protein
MNRFIQRRFLILTIAATLASATSPVHAASAEDLDKSSAQALERLCRSNPVAKTLSQKAKAVLIFPSIIKAGLLFGGSYGEGALLERQEPAGYYNSVSASWGVQAGAQSYSYAVFLMTDKAQKYLRDSRGWEIGVGPTVVIVDEGVAKNLSSSTLKEDAYAFIFGQQGLMAGVSIEGTKISAIQR